MTKLTAYIIGILLVLTSFSIAEARHNNGLEGLIIGGVGGAAIGHVISGTPEGVIVGSFLGGTIGMLIDADHHRNRVVIVKERHRHHRHWPGYYDRGYSSHRGDKHYYGNYGHKNHWRGHKHRWHGHNHRWDRYRGRHLR